MAFAARQASSAGREPSPDPSNRAVQSRPELSRFHGQRVILRIRTCSTWNVLIAISMAALFGVVSSGQEALAAPIDFTSANPNLVAGPNSISQTVNGITMTVQAFTTE